MRVSVTRERIRQIEAKSLRKLRHPSRGKKLRNFVYPNTTTSKPIDLSNTMIIKTAEDELTTYTLGVKSKNWNTLKTNPDVHLDYMDRFPNIFNREYLVQIGNGTYIFATAIHGDNSLYWSAKSGKIHANMVLRWAEVLDSETNKTRRQ